MKRLIREMGALHQNMVKRGLWKEAGPAPKNVVPKGSPNGRSAPVAYTMAGRRSDTGAPGSITNTLDGYTQRMYDDIGRMTTRSEVPPSKVNLKRPTDDFIHPMPKASPLVKGIMTGWNPGRPSYRMHPAQTPTIAPPLNALGHEVPGWRSVNQNGKQIAVTPEGEAFAEYDMGEGNWLAYTNVPHQDPEKIKSMNVFNDPVLKELFPNNQTSQQTTANGPALSALRTSMVPPKRTYTGPVPLNDRGHEVPGWRVVNQNGKQVAVTPEGAAAPPADPATLANAFQDPKFLEYLKWGLPIGAALGLAGYAVGGSKPGTLLPWLLGGAGGGALLGGLYGHYYGGNGETPEGAEGAPAATVPADTNPYVYGPDEIYPETKLPKELSNIPVMPYGEKGSDTRALYNAIPFAGSVFRKGGPVKYVGCKKNWCGYSTLKYEVRDPATGGIRTLYAKPNKNFSRNAADYTWSMDLGDGKQGTVDVPNVRRLILNSFKGADWGIPYDPANPETGAEDAAQLNLYTKQLGI